MLADDAHDDVGGAARPEWHHHLDRLARKLVLGLRPERRHHKAKHQH
jgi:hypothetical protein